MVDLENEDVRPLSDIHKLSELATFGAWIWTLITWEISLCWLCQTATVKRLARCSVNSRPLVSVNFFMYIVGELWGVSWEWSFNWTMILKPIKQIRFYWCARPRMLYTYYITDSALASFKCLNICGLGHLGCQFGLAGVFAVKVGWYKFMSRLCK